MIMVMSVMVVMVGADWGRGRLKLDDHINELVELFAWVARKVIRLHHLSGSVYNSGRL